MLKAILLCGRLLSMPAVLFSLAVAPNALAQTDAAAASGFAAVTIKPSVPGSPNSDLNFGQGRISTKNVPLIGLLKEAYGLSTGSDDQIVGGPVWVRSQPFDIVAKMDSHVAASLDKLPAEQSRQQQDLMLRGLLADRFRLKVHTIAEPRTVAVLTVAGKGSRLKAVAPCDPGPSSTPCAPDDWRGLHNDGHGHVEGKGATLAMLANILAVQPDVGGRLVVDNTGLAGEYDFDLHYSPGDDPQNNGPSLFTALTEQLGLKLTSKKLPVSVLVIDHVDPPSPD